VRISAMFGCMWLIQEWANYFQSQEIWTVKSI
jgi:hypothetical protein